VPVLPPDWCGLRPTIPSLFPTRFPPPHCLSCTSCSACVAPWPAEVDYLKYDNCHVKREAWVIDRYTAMRDALNSTGRPILYSLCEWGVMEPHLWASEVGA
jgi:hypothetical protein